MFDSMFSDNASTWQDVNDSPPVGLSFGQEQIPGINPLALPLPFQTGGEVPEVNIPTQTTDYSDALLVPNDLSPPAPDGPVGTDWLTGQVLPKVYQQLKDFAVSSGLTGTMNLAFGNNWNADTATAITQQWLVNDLTKMPALQVVSTTDIGGAAGAFAAATNTIYISRELMEFNDFNPEAIAPVVLEEVGHYLDSKINTTDAPGDEGAIFAALVAGEELTPAELAALKAEDDSALVVMDGKEVAIEKFDFENKWGIVAKEWNSEEWVKVKSYDSGSNTLSNGQKGFSESWGTGSPRSEIPNDLFRLDMYTQADFERGQVYNFNVTTDDAYAIATKPVGDDPSRPNGDIPWNFVTERKWNKNAGSGQTIPFTFDTEGKHWVVVVYADKEGDASLDISWNQASSTNTSSGINLDNFTGWAMPTPSSQYPRGGVSFRNSTSTNDRSGEGASYHQLLNFDAWTNGESVEDYQLGSPDSRWFRVAGTNYWVPSAYIYGNPDGNSIDSNDLKEEAQELFDVSVGDGEIRGEINESIGETNDQNDFYEFTLNDASRVNLSLSGQIYNSGFALQSDTDIYLYDSSGNFIEGSDNSGTANESIENLELGRGKYYIQVSNLTGNNADYELELSYFSDGSSPQSDSDTSLSSSNFKLPLPGNREWIINQGLDGLSHQSQRQSAIDFGRTNKENGSVNNKQNVPILAAANGQVIRSDFVAPPPGGYEWGNVVWVDHDAPYDGSGYVTVYAHLNEKNVLEGDFVSQGDQLGIMGTSGNVDLHLHFEVMYNEQAIGKSYNPTPVSHPQIQSFLLDGQSLEYYDNFGGRYDTYRPSTNTPVNF